MEDMKIGSKHINKLHIHNILLSQNLNLDHITIEIQKNGTKNNQRNLYVLKIISF
jgi:hypothetical protein